MKTKLFLLLIVITSVLLSSCKRDQIKITYPYPTDGLISYFNFDDNLKDQRDYSKDGVGNAAFTVGKIGKALHFNGVDQQILFSPKNPVTNTTLSVAFWVKSDETAFGKAFMINQYFRTSTWGGNSLIFQVTTDISSSSVIGTYNLNQWAHMVGVYDGKGIYIYINGVLKVGPIANGIFKGFEEAIMLGNNNGSFWSGSIDELYIYNRAISQAEVTQLYNLQ